jgi:hypothetical protein
VTVAPEAATPETAPIVLPTWTDPESIATFLLSAATLVLGTLAATGVIIPAGVSASVQGWAAVAGYVIALGVQAWNSWRVAHTTRIAIASGARIVVMPSRQLLKARLRAQALAA